MTARKGESQSLRAPVSKVSIIKWHKPPGRKTKAGKAKQMEKIRLQVEELPELETEVALAGSARQQEVGGTFCLGVAAGIALYLSA
jgi:hypothetical protein